MSNLPTELVQAIVKRVGHDDLHACSLINRQFHAVTNPILWHSLNVGTSSRFTKLMKCMKTAVSATVPSESESLSSSLGALIRHVHLDFFLTDAHLLTFMKHASRVDDLMMEKANHITDESVQQLARHCPNLKYLKLCGSHITQRSIQAIGEYCHQLSRLFLVSCPGLTCNAFHALVSCPLKSLTVAGCKLIDMDTDDIYYNYDDEDDDDGDTKMILMGRTMNDAVLDLMGFQHLLALEISHCPAAFSYCLIATLNTTTPIIWPGLMKLMLTGCSTLTEHQAITFMHAHPDLIIFGLEGNMFEDTFLEAMASSLHKLEYVDLSFCYHFTAHGVRKLVKQCPYLERLSLDGCGMTIDDFPEAGESCLDGDNDDGFYFVALLDEDAIDEIQQIDSSDNDSEGGDNDSANDGDKSGE